MNIIAAKNRIFGLSSGSDSVGMVARYRQVERLTKRDCSSETAESKFPDLLPWIFPCINVPADVPLLPANEERERDVADVARQGAGEERLRDVAQPALLYCMNSPQCCSRRGIVPNVWAIANSVDKFASHLRV